MKQNKLENSLQPVPCTKGKRQNKFTENQRLKQNTKMVFSQVLELHKRQEAKEIRNSKADITHKNSVQPVHKSAQCTVRKRQEAKQIRKSKAEITHKNDVQSVSCAKQITKSKIDTNKATQQ